eukprot:m.181134 g.181134  ORF g.181134 m.181134 type:complete len:490 (-) comp24588_c0_seq1:216-1685(-)
MAKLWVVFATVVSVGCAEAAAAEADGRDATCVSAAALYPGMNTNGPRDIDSVPAGSAAACVALCCANDACAYFTFTTYQSAGAHKGESMCWRKSDAIGPGNLTRKASCTSGGVRGHTIPSVPRQSKYWTPSLNFVATIAHDPNGNLRDPSAMVQDPGTGRWHFWVDHMNGSTQPGWHADLYHYSAPAIAGPWLSHGLALPHSTDPAAWDSAGTFSPSVIYSAEEKRWFLFYSASSANQSTLLTCAQLVASSPSPDGPWDKLGPVATPTGSPPDWVGSWNSRRVDSGRALIVGGRKGFWTKGVSGKNVASEGLYRPSSAASFAPPWAEAPRGTNPLFPSQPWATAGYENCEFFMAPKEQHPGGKLMHIWCSWHGGNGEPGLPQGPAPHFVVDLSEDPLGTNWTYVDSLSPHNESDPGPTPGEPTPVYEDGPPGDEATVRYFIARMTLPTRSGQRGSKQSDVGLGAGTLAIGLYSLAWTPPRGGPGAAGRV